MVPPKLICTGAIIVMCTCDLIQASTISLTSSPPSITPSLTHDLTMRCGLTDGGDGGINTSTTTASPSGGLVGRKRGLPTNQGKKQTRGLTHTSDDVRAVTSLVLTRDGVDVASVSDYVAAQPLADLGKVKVQGHVDNSAVGEKGYLSLAWPYPTSTQGGNYTCTVHAIDDTGSDVTFSTSVLVDVIEPSIGDLVKAIHDMQVKEDYLVEENKVQNQINSDQQNQITNLQLQLNESRHIENGSIDFGDSRQWKDGRTTTPDKHGFTYNYKDISIKFSKAYKTSPIVYVGLDDAWINKDYYAYFYVDVLKVDPSGFTVRSSIRVDPHTTYLYIDLRLNWLSLPSSL